MHSFRWRKHILYHVFEFMNKCSEEGIKVDKNTTYLIDCCFLADLSCHWKVLNMRGACKVKKMFCHLCGCNSRECAKLKTSYWRCSRCKSAHIAQYHHHKINNDEEIVRKKVRMNELELKYSYLKHIVVNKSWPMF